MSPDIPDEYDIINGLEDDFGSNYIMDLYKSAQFLFKRVFHE